MLVNYNFSIFAVVETSDSQTLKKYEDLIKIVKLSKLSHGNNCLVLNNFNHSNCCVHRSHLVICGGITFDTMCVVVKNFIHKDATVEKTDLVIIDM